MVHDRYQNYDSIDGISHQLCCQLTCSGTWRTPPRPTETRSGPSKTLQKISGRIRSETTTRHRYAIRGYASTAAKHGTAAVTAIRDALAGNPWIPPLPATT